MKINFGKDNSFLEIFPSDDNSTMSLVMCGRKSYREVTMSSAELNKEQVAEIIKFLSEWQEAEE